MGPLVHRVGLDPLQTAGLHGAFLNGGDPITTYDTWDDPPSEGVGGMSWILKNLPSLTVHLGEVTTTTQGRKGSAKTTIQAFQGYVKLWEFTKFYIFCFEVMYLYENLSTDERNSEFLSCIVKCGAVHFEICWSFSFWRRIGLNVFFEGASTRGVLVAPDFVRCQGWAWKFRFTQGGHSWRTTVVTDAQICTSWSTRRGFWWA